MKRTLAALAALVLVALPALGAKKLAVIITPLTTELISTQNSNTTNTAPMFADSRNIVNNLLWRMNPCNVDVYQNTSATNGLIKDGIVGSTQYDAVLWNGYSKSSSSLMLHTGGADPCSLTLGIPNSVTVPGSRMPTKPQMIVLLSHYESEGGPDNLGIDCSSQLCADPGHQGPGADGMLGLNGPNLFWRQPLGAQPSIIDTDTSSAFNKQGTNAQYMDPYLRAIVSSHGSNWFNYPLATGTPPAWRDSIYYSDLAYLYAVPGFYSASLLGSNNQHWFTNPYFNFGTFGWMVWEDGNKKWNDATAAPLVFCHWSTSGLYHNGGIGSTSNHQMGDYATLLCGLAFFDSLTNHAVFGPNPQPLRLALQVSDVARRGYMYAGGGISPADTTTEYATIDSLAKSLGGIPITFSLPADSISNYASEIKTIASKLPQAHFAVELVSDTSAYHLTASAAATAIKVQVGASKFDRVLTMPGGSNALAFAHLGVGPAMNPDSVICALTCGGVFSGITQNAEADSALTATSSPAWNSTQRQWKSGLSSSANLMFLAFPGYNHRGATMGSGRDSTLANYAVAIRYTPQDSTYASDYMQRNLLGAIADHWTQPKDRERVFNRRDSLGTAVQKMFIGSSSIPEWNWKGEPARWGSLSPKANINTGTNIVRISTSSLGSGGWGAASPNRPGYFQIKWLVNAVNAVNALAGRTLITFVYPDQLGPKDIQR